MHPEPLFGILTDDAFEPGVDGEEGGDALFVVTGDGGEGGVEDESVLADADAGGPEGDEGSAGAFGDDADAEVGAGGVTEEGEEGVVVVLVAEDADDFVAAEGGEDGFAGVAARDDGGASGFADGVHPLVDTLLVGVADDDVEFVSGAGDPGGGTLPVSVVAGDEEDAFALGESGFEVVAAFDGGSAFESVAGAASARKEVG